MGKRLRGVIATAAFVAVLIPAVGALANHTPGFDFLVRSNERDVITANYLHDLPYDSDVGWVSGDRLGYRCMYTFLEYNGELVARVTFAAIPEAVGYTVMQTRNGFHEGARYYDGTINTSGSHQTAGPETCIQPGPYEPLAGDPGPLPVITFADAADGDPLEVRNYANAEKAPDALFKIVSATPQLVVVVIYQAGLPVAAVYYELMPNVTNVTLTSNATPPPPPPTPPPVSHERAVSLTLKGHLEARGSVTVEDDFTTCVDGVTVHIRRKQENGWKTVESVKTGPQGKYKAKIKDRAGTYRAEVDELEIGVPVAEVCEADLSPRRRV